MEFLVSDTLPTHGWSGTMLWRYMVRVVRVWLIVSTVWDRVLFSFCFLSCSFVRDRVLFHCQLPSLRTEPVKNWNTWEDDDFECVTTWQRGHDPTRYQNFFKFYLRMRSMCQCFSPACDFVIFTMISWGILCSNLWRTSPSWVDDNEKYPPSYTWVPQG